MGGIEQNERQWGAYAWSAEGDEWSIRLGGPDYQWFGSLLPRMRELLPAGTILEIAPGYGRWTRYLVHLCDRLIGVDVTARCVEPAATLRRPAACELPQERRDVARRGPRWGGGLRVQLRLARSLRERRHRVIRASARASSAPTASHSSITPTWRRTWTPRPGSFRSPRADGAPVVSARVVRAALPRSGSVCIGQELVQWRKKTPGSGTASRC